MLELHLFWDGEILLPANSDTLRALPIVHVGLSPSLINEMTHQQIGDMAA
jgi:hypothetical protein